MMICDLSIAMNDKLPVYPGDPEVMVKRVVEMKTGGLNICRVSMGTHSGTHVDLPLHYVEKGFDAASMPLEKFCGEAVVIEARYVKGSGIKPEAIDTKNIRKNDILIIRTGWEEKAGTQEFFKDFPYFDTGLAALLVDLGVKAVGTDLPSADRAGTNGPAHRKLLSNNIVIFEALVNLKGLVGSRCHFSGMPLKISEGDGSPVRAYAMV